MSAPEELSPLAAEIATLAYKAIADLQFKSGQDAAVWIAVRTLAIPDIAQGLRDTATLAAIDARHQPRTWGDSDVRVCVACQTAFPCTDRRILDGEQSPAVTR